MGSRSADNKCSLHRCLTKRTLYNYVDVLRGLPLCVMARSFYGQAELEGEILPCQVGSGS